MDEAEPEDSVHLPAPHLPLGPGCQLQRRLPEALAGSCDRGVFRGSDPLEVQPLPRVHVRRLLHRGEVLHAQSFHRHRWKNHLACDTWFRAESKKIIFIEAA